MFLFQRRKQDDGISVAERFRSLYEGDKSFANNKLKRLSCIDLVAPPFLSTSSAADDVRSSVLFDDVVVDPFASTIAPPRRLRQSLFVDRASRDRLRYREIQFLGLFFS